MATPITASMLYDLVSCEHRVTMDIFTDPSIRDEVNPFVQLLWEKGSLFEKEVMDDLKEPFLDLSIYSEDEKEQKTTEAMERNEKLIYGGRIQKDNLLGIPDLLRFEGDGYIAGDIKSGVGMEGSEDSGKPKMHYAMQLAIYTDILERKGISSGRRAFVWDIRGEEVMYDLTKPYGSRNPIVFWDEYQTILKYAKNILNQSAETYPAFSAICKLCHWFTACSKRLNETGDLTLIPELGRAKRVSMFEKVKTIKDFSKSNPNSFVAGKKTIFPGIGLKSLMKFHERACLLSSPDGKPYLTEQVIFPEVNLELFFDIEVDPMRDICYLHGFVERRDGNNDTEKFVAFFAESTTKEAEEKAFADAWKYIKKSQPCAVYYYSKYERTIYRKLREKYPHVCTENELESFFEPKNTIDLYYDVVLKKTEWPTNNYSIKTLAKYLGFDWRDTHPSGAASIEWYNRWVETEDEEVKERILDYNEDDCRATRVLLDGIRDLEVKANR